MKRKMEKVGEEEKRRTKNMNLHRWVFWTKLTDVKMTIFFTFDFIVLSH